MTMQLCLSAIPAVAKGSVVGFCEDSQVGAPAGHKAIIQASLMAQYDELSMCTHKFASSHRKSFVFLCPGKAWCC